MCKCKVVKEYFPVFTLIISAIICFAYSSQEILEHQFVHFWSIVIISAFVNRLHTLDELPTYLESSFTKEILTFFSLRLIVEVDHFILNLNSRGACKGTNLLQTELPCFKVVRIDIRILEVDFHFLNTVVSFIFVESRPHLT
jgi:hypothetical protein